MTPPKVFRYVLVLRGLTMLAQESGHMCRMPRRPDPNQNHNSSSVLGNSLRGMSNALAIRLRNDIAHTTSCYRSCEVGVAYLGGAVLDNSPNSSPQADLSEIGIMSLAETVAWRTTSGIFSLRNCFLLMDILDHFDVRDGDEPLAYHLIQEGQ